MAGILIFGLGYTASRLAERWRATGWTVLGTRREASADAMAFEDEESVRIAIAGATHILSSVPPDDGDPVLYRYGALLPDHRLGYLSSTGVYGDTRGAWVDESAPTGSGRRSARAEADAQWLERGARVFRLPGIYGPGRSALDRVAEGRAQRIDLPGQVFSRIHVDDIVDAIIAGFDGPPGAYNIADDAPCSQNAVIEEACRLLRRPPPPLRSLDAAGLSPMARAFYAENRRVANGKAKRILGWQPRYPDYRAGLAACLACSATTSPAIASRQPNPA
ncbi:SDR family NAD(P)-dependent oxidoreductase [Sphingomonas sp. CGMCC 1.13654]|uniref:SDR family NAD(P)-dependent oxidoreductase n=1 Tax=Sphingomonas chungangi TaxID=2683589 RepID=A0A838L8K7_9SPHN|nr:SDR family NAD(P)-dependent oxidoreductase [Sphingomonas chungangi]MBA2934879.1 SDR family NAD(P)-dependent oxidoreductase [Sphingomonas chungangi]MVW58190.1 SDR family NAD(P)-dependent oxidoreductase [Sphingomonas chungangi]